MPIDIFNWEDLENNGNRWYTLNIGEHVLVHKKLDKWYYWNRHNGWNLLIDSILKTFAYCTDDTYDANTDPYFIEKD